jgi:hypothetical protein
MMIESPQGYGVGQKVLGDPHGRPNTKKCDSTKKK